MHNDYLCTTEVNGMREIFNDYVKSMTTYIMFKIKAAANRLRPELEAKGRSPIFLSMGAPTAPPPKLLLDRLKSALDEDGIHLYSIPRGESFFLEAIAKYMKRRFNVSLDPKTEISALLGSKEGLANFLRALINPILDDKEKDVVFVPDPGYASYGQMVEIAGGKTFSVPLTPENNYMPDFEEVLKNLEKDGYNPKKVKAVAFNYPNNPMGATCTNEYMQKAVDFCIKHHFILLGDAAYIDLNLPGTDKIPSILTFENAKDVAIEFYSFSKSFAMTGWRMGWACGNKVLIDMLGKMKSSLDTGLFKPLQIAGAAILNSKEGDEYIIESNKKYKRKQDILLEGFKKMGWPIDESLKPKATFYLWLPVPPRYKSSEEFTNYVLETSGVVFVPGSAFGKNGEMWFRISATATEPEIKEAVERLIADGLKF